MYLNKKYLNENRLMAYLEQYKYISDGDFVLDIGNGAGVFQFLTNKIAKCHTIDNNPITNPDYVVDIVNEAEMSKINKIYNKIFCCQVLEHLPFEQVKIALNNILKLNARLVCISIPNNMQYFKLAIKIPFVKLQTVITLPYIGIKTKKINHLEHYWEICGKNKNEVVTILINIAKQNDYELITNYRLFYRPYQHFFIFKKTIK